MEGDLRWCCGSSSSNNNWDLHAVVRFASCSGGSAGRVTSPRASDDSSWLPLLQPQKDELRDAAALPQLPGGPAVDDLCLQQVFSAAPKPDKPQPKPEALPQLPPAKPPGTNGNGSGVPTRSKRRKKKSQVSKAVTRVPVGASADPWAWRKYGQKPIKGSPYPRGYYRCSTDKDCKARKHVERCRTDPSTLLVSYTGEHSHPVPLHRNSLAGTTRNKPRQASSSTSPAVENDAVAASLLLEEAAMEGEEDVLLLMAAPSPSNGGDSKDVKLFPELKEPAPGEEDNGSGGWENVMLFSEFHEPPAGSTPGMTSSSRTDGMAQGRQRRP